MKDIDDIVVDDSELLADRLIRSLHKNPDGHLAGSRQGHDTAIEEKHNVAVLYVYTVDTDEAYMVHEHYVHSHEPLNYKAWRKVVLEECDKLIDEADKSFHGIYGWATAFVQITPMRNGDLLIKIDKEGARGVRLTFDSTKTKRTSRKR